MMEKKIPDAIGNQILPLKCSFGIRYGIGRKYLPIWVSDLNQNSGFGRTLQQKWLVSWEFRMRNKHCAV